jgi:hypothetical protein
MSAFPRFDAWFLGHVWQRILLFAHLVDQLEVGPWSVERGKGYASRPFWILTRRNKAWQYGQETLLNASRRDARRFYDEAKAIAEAERLNDDGPPPAFTCPRCGRQSWNPGDAKHGWCGACKAYTAEPKP